MRIQKEIKRVVLYLRYSSDRQQETSIEGQDDVCSHFCEFNGYEIVGRYIDRAVSARKDVKKRKEFLRMIDDAKHGLFDAVVVYKLDRFSRDQFTTAIYTKALTDAGVAIISASENLNNFANDGGMSSFMIGVMNAFAVYYSDELSQKVSRGMRVAAEKCQYNGGFVPIGYKIVEKRYVVDEEKAPIVRRIFSDYVSGVPMVEIIRKCKEDGVKLSKQGLEHLLVNEKYIGVYKFGDIRVEDGIPALIDKNLFLKAKELISKRSIGPRGRNGGSNQSYLLTGKIYCGECGSPMTGVSHHGRNDKYHYYSCSMKQKGQCQKRMVRQDMIEKLVLDESMNLYRDEDLKRLFVSTFTKVFSKIMKGTVDERSALEARIRRLEDQKRKALDAIIMNPEIGNELRARVDEYNVEIVSLQRKLEAHSRNLETLKVDEDLVQEFLDSVFLEGKTDEATKKRIIDSLVQKVTVWDGGHVEIIFNVLKAPVLAEIEKSPVLGDFSHLLREDGVYNSTVVDRPKKYKHQYCYFFPGSILLSMELPPELITAKGIIRSRFG